MTKACAEATKQPKLENNAARQWQEHCGGAIAGNGGRGNTSTAPALHIQRAQKKKNANVPRKLCLKKNYASEKRAREEQKSGKRVHGAETP